MILQARDLRYSYDGERMALDGVSMDIAQGEKIAEVGSTGNATGPHLHLELKLDGMHLDPTQYVETKSP